MDIIDMKRLKPDFLRPARKRGSVCPWCGNGTGKDGTGIEPFGDPPSYRCHVCGEHGDVIDLFGAAFGIENEKEKFRRFRAYYNIEPDKSGSIQKNNERKKAMKENTETKAETKKEETAGESFMDYYNVCMSCVGEGSDYFVSRGISPFTQKHFRLGIDPAWRHPNAPESVTPMPRAIIPISKTAYLARDIRKDVPENMKQYDKQNVGNVSIFNPAAFKNITPVNRMLYVTEGPFDAMSVYEAGGNAIALCGIANTGMLIDYIKDHPILNPYILIMFDNDERGRAGAADLSAKLHEIGTECKIVNYDSKYNDPNDFLVKNRQGLYALVQCEQAYHDAIAVSQIAVVDYFRHIETQEPVFEAKTGFRMLDQINGYLYGGIHEGLHGLGAMPSEGKTTILVQVTDQTAQTGTHVMYFSTEQTKRELAGKSIARETYVIAGDKKINVSDNEVFLAKDYRQITSPGWYKLFNTEERAVIDQAIKKYETYCKNITVIDREAVIRGTCGQQKTMTAEYIARTVREYIARTGIRPVVIVDFLQDLAPVDPRMTDKQSTDQSIAELKALAMLYHIPVIIISSFNRLSYTEPINMSAFKESGSIEYSSDFLYGLQQHGMDYSEEDKGANGAASRKARIMELRETNERKASIGEPILMDFKCLKQRNGMKFNVVFKAVPRFGYFTDNVGETNFIPTETSPFEDNGFTQTKINLF